MWPGCYHSKHSNHFSGFRSFVLSFHWRKEWHYLTTFTNSIGRGGSFIWAYLEMLNFTNHFYRLSSLLFSCLSRNYSHIFNKYLLSILCITHILLFTWDTTENKIGKTSCSPGVHSLTSEADNKSNSWLEYLYLREWYATKKLKKKSKNFPKHYEKKIASEEHFWCYLREENSRKMESKCESSEKEPWLVFWKLYFWLMCLQ